MIDFYLSHQLTQTKKQRQNLFLKKNKKIQKILANLLTEC